MIKKIMAIASLSLLFAGTAVTAQTIPIANGSFLANITPLSDFSQEDWNGWQREYFYWGEIDGEKMVLTSSNPKTLMPTSFGAMAEGRAVRQRSVPISECIEDYSSNYADYSVLVKARITMSELSDIYGADDGIYNCTDKKSYAELALGAYDPWNPAVVTRLVRLIKDDGAETYSVYVNTGVDGRSNVPNQLVKSGVAASKYIDVAVIFTNDTVKYFIDGKFCGVNSFTQNKPHEAYDVGFYCVGGSEADPIVLLVDDVLISAYENCTDTYSGEDDDTVDVSFSMDGSLELTLSGSMKKEKLGENITLSVLSQEQSEVALAESCIGDGGQFEITVLIPSYVQAGTYTYKLTLDNGKVITAPFEMPDYNTMLGMIETIKGCDSESEILEILNVQSNLCSGFEILEGIYPSMDKSFVAKKFYEAVKSNTFPDKVSDLTELAKEYTVISVFNQNLEEYTKSVLGKYVNDIGFSDECINYYRTALSVTGVNNVVNNMTSKSFNSYADIEKRFRNLVYTNYITNNSAIGAVNRNEIIADSKNTLGFEITNTSEKVISAMANSGAATPELLQNAYITALKPQSPGGSSGGGSGGGGGSSTGYVPPVVSDDSPTQLSKGVYFDDLTNHAWAAEAINGLYEKNIINGKSDRAYFPQDSITREEAIVLIVRMFGFSANSETELIYRDVSSDAWYYSQVKAASDNNIVGGISDDYMGIGMSVTRQDFLTMLLRAVITESSVNVYEVANEKEYTDNKEIDEYAKEAVRLFSGLEVINGYDDGSFRPKNTITRAEAAQMLYKVYKLKEGDV